MDERKLWKLAPTGRWSIHWEGSVYHGDVIVRAEDEAEARLVAVRALGIAVRHWLGRDAPLSPWKEPNLVECTLIGSSPGSSGLISPPEWR